MTAETANSQLGQVRSPDEVDEKAKFKTGVRRLMDNFARMRSPYEKRMDLKQRYNSLVSLTSTRGRRYAGCEFSNFTVATDNGRLAIAKLQEFVETMEARMDGCDGNLVLLGPPGTGKDHLLMAVMREAIVQFGFAVHWMDGVRLFNEIKSGIADGDVERRLSELVNVQVLAISDPVPPRDELSAYELAILRDVIERRYSHGMATWVTTNVQSSEDARRLFTAPVLGRLLDGATEVFCDWGNHRTTFKKAK